jgi:hypothetical protein
VNRWRSFSSVPKEEMHLSVPCGLMKEFREYARSLGVKPNELMTYMLCDALSRDPTEFGLHPLRDRAAVDE